MTHIHHPQRRLDEPDAAWPVSPFEPGRRTRSRDDYSGLGPLTHHSREGRTHG